MNCIGDIWQFSERKRNTNVAFSKCIAVQSSVKQGKVVHSGKAGQSRAKQGNAVKFAKVSGIHHAMSHHTTDPQSHKICCNDEQKWRWAVMPQCNTTEIQRNTVQVLTVEYSDPGVLGGLPANGRPALGEGATWLAGRKASKLHLLGSSSFPTSITWYRGKMLLCGKTDKLRSSTKQCFLLATRTT